MQNREEKPKLKHNKKRNTAFLFEALVKELTKSVVYSDKQKQKVTSGLLKEHFKKNSLLDKELTLYKQIYETNEFPKDSAEKLINRVKEEYDKLDENEIYSEQSKLIAKINKTLGFEVYNNFVPKYKTLATLSQIFNKKVEPRSKVLLEQELIAEVTSKKEKNKADAPKQIDNLTFNTFLDKFNKTYGNSLITEQKNLLNRYIASNGDDLDLKIFLSEEIGRIKGELKNISTSEYAKSNEQFAEQAGKLFENINSLKIGTVDETLIKKIMLIQEFIHEVKN
jgi:hypothetical protein